MSTVNSGQTVSGIVLRLGDGLYVQSGGLSIDTTVYNGGSEDLQGGTSSGTRLAFSSNPFFNGAGTQLVEAGGRAIGTQIEFGNQLIYPGGIASGTLLPRGTLGQQLVMSNAAASGTVISGGRELVEFGGAAIDTIIAGGSLSLTTGSIAVGKIDFARVSGGALEIEGPTMPQNTISGLVPGDEIDLRNVAYDSAGTATLLPGNLLQITENGASVNLQLDPMQDLSHDAFRLSSYRAVVENRGTTIAVGTPVANDFNNDGEADVLWRAAGDGTVALWEMNGAQIRAAQNVGSVGTDGWKVVGIGDINDDTRADVIWRSVVDGTIAAWEMNGFQIAAAQNVVKIPASDWNLLATGDFDGDGKTDLLFRHTAVDVVSLYELDGFKIKAAANVGNVGAVWKVVGAGDIDGDGKADVIWRNTETGAVSAWEMNGFEVKAGQSVGTVGLDWTVAGLADVNGDGKADILWRNTNNGSVSLWQLNGFQIKSAQSVADVSPNWTIANTLDTNGDGKADIVWRNSSGAVEVTQMNGASVVQTQDVATVGTNWNVIGPMGEAASPPGASSPEPEPQSAVGFTTVGGSAAGGDSGVDLAAASAAARDSVVGVRDAALAGSRLGFADNGNVTVWGGSGLANQVPQSGGSGSETVTGFSDAGGQGISFPNETAAAIANVITSARTDGGNTVVTLPDGSTLTLAGVTRIDSSLFR